MKRIRIGNDIRVQTTLHELNDFDSTAVKQVLCYFIPEKDTAPSQPKTYDPAQYNICNCGRPMYNVFPCNIDAPHWFPGYNGFGVNSMQFVHRQDKYLALARVLKEQNKVEAYFPAKEQRLIGEYKVVFVVVMYEDGWDKNNLRTYTIDKGVVFALTSDNDDITADTTIDLDIPYVVKIQVPAIIRMTGDVLRLGQTMNNVKYQITLIYSDGTKSVIDSPDKYSGIITTSKSVKGYTQVNNTGDIVRDKYNYCEAYITYILYDNPEIQTEMNVFSGSIFRTIQYDLDPAIVSVSGQDEVEIDSAMPNGLALFEINFTLDSSVKQLKVTADNARIKHAVNDPASGPYILCTPVTGNVVVTAEVISADTGGGHPNPDPSFD